MVDTHDATARSGIAAAHLLQTISVDCNVGLRRIGAAELEFALRAIISIDHPPNLSSLPSIMSAATVGRGSSISQNLRTTKEILHDMVFGAKYVEGGGIACVG